MTLAARPAEARTETATCPICSTTGLHRRLPLREMMFGTREVFDYLLCDGCGTIRIADIPPDLDRHYPARYHYERLAKDMLPGSDVQRRLVGIGVRADFTGSGRWAARIARRFVPPPAGYRRWRASFGGASGRSTAASSTSDAARSRTGSSPSGRSASGGSSGSIRSSTATRSSRECRFGRSTSSASTPGST